MLTTIAASALLCGRLAHATPTSAVAAPTKPESTALVRVSSDVELEGRAFGLKPGRPRLLILTGVAQFTGAGLTSDPTQVSVSAVVDGAPGCISGWARPAMDVLLERDDRYVAGARVEGTVPVSGCVRGGELSLSGRGRLSGDALVAP